MKIIILITVFENAEKRITGNYTSMCTLLQGHAVKIVSTNLDWLLPEVHLKMISCHSCVRLIRFSWGRKN